MRTILILLRKDFLHFRRDRGTVIMTFLVPITMVYLFGQVYGVNRRTAGGAMATELVGGWAMQFLLFALVSSANSLFEEKQRGIFQRILSGSVPPSAILYSKFLYGASLGLLQLLLLFVGGWLLFRINFIARLVPLAAVCLCAAAACSAIGMLLASFSSTAETARGLATLTILTMSALGGAWFPVSFLPPPMQRLSRFTPVYWSIRGFLQVLWEHASFLRLLPTLALLAATAAAVLAAAWVRFSRGRLFD